MSDTNQAIPTTPHILPLSTRQSENIDKLAIALAKAQGQMVAPKMTKEVSFGSGAGSRSYKYADLASVLEVIKKPLADNELAIFGQIRPGANDILLVTTLMHSSGQWISSSYPVAKNLKPQDMGSHITYGRRYSISFLLNIAGEEDDDGQAAQEGSKTDASGFEPKPNGSGSNAASRAGTGGGKNKGAGSTPRPPAEQEATETHQATDEEAIEPGADVATVKFKAGPFKGRSIKEIWMSRVKAIKHADILKKMLKDKQPITQKEVAFLEFGISQGYIQE